MSEEFKRDSVVLDFAKVTEMVVKDLSKNTSAITKSYTKANVATYLANTKRYAKELQGMSAYLYDFSPHYRRLVNYYANMATLDYYVELHGLDTSKNVNVKSLRNNYNKALDFVELMNIRHEFRKALVSAWKLGTFYGFELYTKDTYFIKELPYDFCQISGIADGVYTFSFDVSYFERNADQLELYPKEFVKMYNSYKSGKSKWQEVDPSRSICIKVNEESYNDIPPFAGLFGDIFDIESYKALRLASAVMGNYKFIVEKIPMREDSDKNNDFRMDLKTVAIFHNKTAALLPDEIGIFSTPFEIDTVEFSKDTSEVDNVANAENAFYTSAGTAKQLFNPEGGTSSLSKSISVDEAEVFGVLRQLERIGTGKIKNAISGSFKFRLRILDNTIFNRKERIEELLQSAQYGLPVKIMLCACLGIAPSSIVSMNFLEEEVLMLTDNFRPLTSSHTQSGDEESTDDGGRPEIDEDDLSEKGESQREGEDNKNRE